MSLPHTVYVEQRLYERKDLNQLFLSGNEIMARRPFEKVSAGPGQVYDTEYNAFLDVARRARGGQDVDLTKIAKGVVVPCVNKTENDYKAFDVVQFVSAGGDADPDPNEFKYKTPVLAV